MLVFGSNLLHFVVDSLVPVGLFEAGAENILGESECE